MAPSAWNCTVVLKIKTHIPLDSPLLVTNSFTVSTIDCNLRIGIRIFNT